MSARKHLREQKVVHDGMFDLLNYGFMDLFLNGLFQFSLSVESNSVNAMNLGFNLKLSLLYC